MKRKLVIAALPAIFIGVAGTPALADCPADTFYLYETAGYQDGEYRYKPTTSCTNLGSGINNDANSMRNYRNYNVRMWDLPGCGGSLTYTARAFSYDSDFGNNGFSNKASSLKRVRSANRRGDASDRVPGGAGPRIADDATDFSSRHRPGGDRLHGQGRARRPDADRAGARAAPAV